MFSIVAKKYPYVAGIDTHAKKHACVLINNLGEQIWSGECRGIQKDFYHLLLTVKRRVAGSKVLFAIEGTSSYGELLTKYLMDSGEDVCEVKPPTQKSRGGVGKSDLIDAEMAARSVLYIPTDRLIQPRVGDLRKTLRIICAARTIMAKQHTMDKNALNALMRSNDVGVDMRCALTVHKIRGIAKKITTEDMLDNGSVAERVARIEAERLANSIINNENLLYANKKELTRYIQMVAPSLLLLPGVGPVSAAVIICAYSHKGRFRSAAAFASLGGVAPIPASSGNVVRHRINHHGDRVLNNALDVIARTNMRQDEETQLYIKKRMERGSSLRETRRALKRYTARRVYKLLESLNLGVD